MIDWMVIGRSFLIPFVVSGAAVLATFAIAGLIGIDTDHFGGPASDAGLAGLGIGLLSVDAIAPVPSSAVIATLGARFGILFGSLFAIVGVILGSLGAFAVGRAVHHPKTTHETETGSAYALIAVTRCVPIASEAAAYAAGASGIPCTQFTVACSVGAVPFVVTLTAAATPGTSTTTRVVAITLAVGLAIAGWRSHHRTRVGR
ncbi:MAG TPA: VTT domain-containing protein [Microbacterium sp.]|nr:VTT domain-containing protein [Microbacterium sp.]